MNYNLEHYVFMNLKTMGHDVRFYGYRRKLGALSNPIRMGVSRSSVLKSIADSTLFSKMNSEIKEIASQFTPDLVLVMKGEFMRSDTVNWFNAEIGSQTALWYPDDPRFFGSLVEHIAGNYDRVFTTSPRAVEMYKSIGVKNISVISFACEPTIHRTIDLSNNDKTRYGCDVCFIGTWTPKRARIISRLGVFRTKVYGPYWRRFFKGFATNDAIWGNESVKAYNAARIVLNIHEESDLLYKPNMRVFEAPGARSFLLTDRPKGLEKFFSVGKELDCYDNSSELVELVKYYLGDEKLRTELATAGQKRAYSDHTYHTRITSLLDSLR